MVTGARSAWPWAALPLVAAVAVDPWGLAPFGPAKWALVPALVFAGTALSQRTPSKDARATPASTGPLGVVSRWALPVFVAWTAVSAVFGLDDLYAWTGTPERHFGLVTWVLALLCWRGGQRLDRPSARLVLRAVAATAGLIGAWATAEALGWRPFPLVGVTDRALGPFGSSAFLGAAAALCAPVAVGAAIQWRGRARIFGLSAAALGLVAHAASGARAAWFGAAVAALVALCASKQRRTVVVAGALCAGALLVAAVSTGAADRAGDIVSDRNGGARGRLDEWRVALRVIADRPLIGAGPEGYRIAFGGAVDDRYERDHGRDPLPDRAHSAPLDVAATTGVVGLALYLGAVAVALRAAWRALRHGPPSVAGAGVGVVAYFAQSLFLFPIAELEPVVWLLAGVCAAATSDVLRPHGWAQHVESRVVRVAAGGLAVVALVAGVLDVAADRRAKAQLAAVAADTPPPASLARLRPDQVRYWLVAARAHASNGSTRGIDRALADLDDALDISPRDPVARNEKAGLLLAKARRDNTEIARARAHLEQLAADDPRNAAVLLRLGVVSSLAGDDTAAVIAWRRAERLAPRSGAASSNLAVAYAKAGRTEAARAAAKRALRRDPANRAARAVLESLDANGT